MKFIKPFLLFLFFVLVAATLLSLIVPVTQKIEKSVTINAPVTLVYEQLARLENFSKWSVWSQQDSAAKYTLTGTDGTVGAICSWTGNPGISGEGRIEIVALDPGKRVAHSLHFSKPKERTARSTFILKESGGVTSITWDFEIDTPRPWNIFNLFYSMDKQMGKDFEWGLSALKNMTETKAGTASKKTYEVLPMNFPATSFAMIRQQVKWSDISAFYQQHLPILYEEAVKANVTAGTATGLYFMWDEKNQQADMAAAIPVPPGTKIENSIISMVDIPASKAVYVNYSGAYDRLKDVYGNIVQYLEANKLKQKSPVVEQYISGPATEKDTAKWLTKIVYLVE